jgi:hypothetical protein
MHYILITSFVEWLLITTLLIFDVARTWANIYTHLATCCCAYAQSLERRNTDFVWILRHCTFRQRHFSCAGYDGEHDYIAAGVLGRRRFQWTGSGGGSSENWTVPYVGKVTRQLVIGFVVGERGGGTRPGRSSIIGTHQLQAFVRYRGGRGYRRILARCCAPAVRRRVQTGVYSLRTGGETTDSNQHIFFDVHHVMLGRWHTEPRGVRPIYQWPKINS